MENNSYYQDCDEEETEEVIENVCDDKEKTDLGTKDVPEMSENNPRGNIFFLNIIGQIEGHMVQGNDVKTTKYEHVIPALVAACENKKVDGVLVILNTVGGDVEAGLAISELISKLGKPTVSLVIGGGHSIGVPLAVSANYSFIAPSATMTIHPVRMSGTMIGVSQTYNYFEMITDRITDFIVANSKITKQRFKELMTDPKNLATDVGTVLVGSQAVFENLIDEMGGLYDALEKLYSLIEVNREKLKNDVHNTEADNK